jgi:hypothetical protein
MFSSAKLRPLVKPNKKARSIFASIDKKNYKSGSPEGKMEVQKSGSPEVQKSGSPEVQKSGSPEVQKSRSPEVQSLQ